MEKANKLEQEVIEHHKDEMMRKQHAIMQAQRRQLQSIKVEHFNKEQTLGRKIPMIKSHD